MSRRASRRRREPLPPPSLHGTGRFDFVLRTGRDMADAPGWSNVRDAVIHPLTWKSNLPPPRSLRGWVGCLPAPANRGTTATSYEGQRTCDLGAPVPRLSPLVLRPLAVAAVVTTSLLVPAAPASACSAVRSPENPIGYCESPRPVDESPRPAPTQCQLSIVTYHPAYPAWGLDGTVRQAVGVFAYPRSTVTLTGYSRPSTEVRQLGTATANSEGYVNLPVSLQGNTRLFATSDASLCEGRTATAVADVQARLGGVHATRSGLRTYRFEGFYAGPHDKVGSLYRVPDGRPVLTAQTRLRGEFWSITRRFLASGDWPFFLRVGTDINGVGAESPRRRTVIH